MWPEMFPGLSESGWPLRVEIVKKKTAEDLHFIFLLPELSSQARNCVYLLRQIAGADMEIES